MDTFNGIIRDTLPINNPDGTAHWGKNMLNNKDYKAASNEHGFSFEYLIEGIVIGTIVTNSDIVYFSKNKDGTDEIGVVNTETQNPIYTTKIKSELFNFQLNCPIEGIFVYNYNKELIISWVDGIYDNSNKPYLVNLDNLPIKINTDGTLIDNEEFTKLFLNPDIIEGDLSLEYIKGSDLKVETIYISYNYVLDNRDSLPSFSFNTVAYTKKTIINNTVSFGFLNDSFSTFIPKIILNNLDSNYNKLQLNFITKDSTGVLSGYKTTTLSYENSTLSFTLSNLTSLDTVDPSSLLIESTFFEKAQSITIQNNQGVIGNTITSSDFNFQKYANLLKLKPVRKEVNINELLSVETFEETSSLMPDEVYSFNIELHKLNGSYTKAYHIPGDILEQDDLTDDLTSFINQGYNIPNIDSPKSFHIFNKGVIRSSLLTSSFGKWQNESEVYPDTEDYNSTEDYENNSITNGEDLRGKNIRYHRVPSIEDSHNFVYGGLVNNIAVNNSNLIRFRIGAVLTNFDNIVPQEIKDQIQGYRISFVKRNQNNNLVLGNWMGTRVQLTPDAQPDCPVLTSHENAVIRNFVPDGQFSFNTYFVREKGMFLFGTELFKDTPSLSLSYIKTNYVFNAGNDNVDDITKPYKFTPFAKVDNKYKFGTGDDLLYNPENNFEAGTQYCRRNISINTTGNVQGDNIQNIKNNPCLNITAFSSLKDLYQGFRSDSLAILGTVKDFNSPIELYGGDVFISQGSELAISFLEDHGEFISVQRGSVPLEGLYTPYKSTNVKLEDSLSGFNTGITIYPDESEAATTIEFTEEVVGMNTVSIKDLPTIVTNTFILEDTNRFPFRVNRSLTVENESLSINSLRTYPINDYYDFPNDKGEILAVRGTNRKLFIQMQYTLFIAAIKDKLQTQNIDAYLGEGDIFDRTPIEVFPDKQGHIGSTSKFSCVIIKGIYITVNQSTGQIFIVKDSVTEISRKGLKNWFRDNLDIGFNYNREVNSIQQRIDNPFISVGHLVGYDKEFERLLFTKKYYEFIGDASLYDFDGEFYTDKTTGDYLDFNNKLLFKNLSNTFSYSLESNQWLYEHDYFPNIIFNTHSDLYSIKTTLEGKSEVYRHNDKTTKGLYYNEKFESYIELNFNKNLSITKLYQSIHWVTTVINQNNGIEKFKTINKILIYNENQCSGILNIKDNIKREPRNNEWYFNEFRDVTKVANFPIIDNSGEVVESNLNNFKLWFDKSNFISKFITVRLIIDNIDEDDVFIHQVNIKSIPIK